MELENSDECCKLKSLGDTIMGSENKSIKDSYQLEEHLVRIQEIDDALWKDLEGHQNRKVEASGNAEQSDEFCEIEEALKEDLNFRKLSQLNSRDNPLNQGKNYKEQVKQKFEEEKTKALLPADININFETDNPLAAILENSQILLQQLDEFDHVTKEKIKKIRTETMRIANIVNDVD